MDLTLQEKLKLINFFEFLLNKEASKPIDEMNMELIDAYVKLLLHLQDKHVELDSDYIDEQVRKIFNNKDEATAPETVKTKKKHINKRTVWLVAACISILVALFSVISVAYDWNVFDFLTEKFGSVISSPVDEEIEYNGISVYFHGESTIYPTIEAAFKDKKVNALYPTSLPNNIFVEDIMVYERSNKDVIVYVFNDPSLCCGIYLNTTLSQEALEKAQETFTINTTTYYVTYLEDINVTQIEFEYKGNVYYISHLDKDILIEIIEGLEEISYEN